MNRPALDIFRNRRTVVHWLPNDVEDSPERRFAHRHCYRSSRVFDVHSPHNRIGRGHGDCTHLVAADVLLDLDDDIDVDSGVRLAANPQRVVKLRKVLRLERDVENGTYDLHDLPDVVLLLPGIGLGGFFPFGTDGCCHDYPSSAADPPTISAISCVICAWRARLNVRRNTLSISPALSVAFFIAVRRAARSPPTLPAPERETQVPPTQ